MVFEVCSNKGPRVKDGPEPGVLGLNHRNTWKNIFKNLFLQNDPAQMLEIYFIVLPSGPAKSLFNGGPGIQNGPVP